LALLVWSDIAITACEASLPPAIAILFVYVDVQSSTLCI